MGIRVLVIEDEENIADYLVRGLREEGFVAERAADGLTAWEALRSGPWDLVLLDWWLPGQDGLAILQRFRQLDRHTPVLFLTARELRRGEDCIVADVGRGRKQGILLFVGPVVDLADEARTVAAQGKEGVSAHRDDRITGDRTELALRSLSEDHR